jgi:two-component system, LuxR family, sensor kinase FixL
MNPFKGDTALATSLGRLIARRLSLFAVVWLGTTLVWTAVLFSESRLSITTAVAVVALEAAMLASMIVICRMPVAADWALIAALSGSIILGASVLGVFFAVRGNADFLAYVLLTLYLTSALFFGWGWRSALALLAATLAGWLLVLPQLAIHVPDDELVGAILVGSVLSLGIAEGYARAFRDSFHHERELRASRERFQLILDGAAVVIHVKDPAGRYLFVNRYWERLFHARSEEVVGKTAAEFHSQEIIDPLRENDREVLASRQPIEFEETVIQDGSPLTFLSVKVPLFDVTGSAIGVCGISKDITARKVAEAELRRSEAALAALISNTTDGIWSIDRNYQVTVINSAARSRFRKYFGAEFNPAKASEGTPAELVRQMRALYDRAFAGERIQVEQTYDLPDGSQRHFLVLLNPVIESDQVTGAAVFAREITELKHAERQAREHRTQLAHVLRLSTMGEMASGLAHEINQPLGAIVNYARGCERRLRAGSVDQSELRDAVHEIAREALRAGEIIRRLRDLVRKDSPRQETADVNQLVREAVAIIEPEARHAGIALRLEAALDLPRVACDSIQIEQVILNLLLNGVDALEAAGNGKRTLAVETAISIGGAVEVAVSDTGIGLPAPPADVFAPFFSTKAAGLGMGLSISRSIIEAHGGRLWATSNCECGSTFRFTLPLAKSDLG